MRRISMAPGTHPWVMSPFLEPIATVSLGEDFIVETLDGPGGNLYKDSDIVTWSKENKWGNPETGPIYVDGVNAGDTLVVNIKEIRPLWDYALTYTVPGCGGLVPEKFRYITKMDEDISGQLKVLKIEDGTVYFSDKISFPYKPFFGCIGTAPEIEAIATLAPGSHGGNMDCSDVKPGAKVYLPVRHDGAMLFFGDVMATQGDGEVCGTAGEHPGEGIISCDVIKGQAIEWPRVENSDWIMTIGSARPMEDAVRIAYAELVRWMVDSYGFTRSDAYMLLSHVGKLRIGNIVNTLYSVVAKIEKKYLEMNR